MLRIGAMSIGTIVSCFSLDSNYMSPHCKASCVLCLQFCLLKLIISSLISRPLRTTFYAALDARRMQGTSRQSSKPTFETRTHTASRPHVFSSGEQVCPLEYASAYWNAVGFSSSSCTKPIQLASVSLPRDNFGRMKGAMPTIWPYRPFNL